LRLATCCVDTFDRLTVCYQARPETASDSTGTTKKLPVRSHCQKGLHRTRNAHAIKDSSRLALRENSGKHAKPLPGTAKESVLSQEPGTDEVNRRELMHRKK
jgi:hypothetical protein